MTTSPATVPRRGRAWRMLTALGGLVVLVGGGYTIYGEMQRAERDRHAVIEEVRELERLIRRHDGQLFLRLGVAPDADPAHAERESLLRDFERLSDLDGFRITDLDVAVTGAAAVARYKGDGRAARPDLGGRSDQTMTRLAGEITFARHGTRWEIVGHRFVGPTATIE